MATIKNEVASVTIKGKGKRNARKIADATALAVSDAALRASFAELVTLAGMTTTKADEVIALSNDATVEACEAGLREAVRNGRTAGLAWQRMTYGLSLATIRRSMEAQLSTMDRTTADFADNAAAAYRAAKLRAGVACEAYIKPQTKSAEERESAESRAMGAAHQLAQLGCLYDGLRWLRIAAETSPRKVEGILTACFASFARFNPSENQWRLVTPSRSGSEGVDDTMTTEDSQKLETIFRNWSIGKLNTTSEVSAAIVAAGLKAKSAKGNKSATDKADDDKADKADKATGTGSPVSVDFVALGKNATLAQILDFVSAAFTADKIGANKVDAMKVVNVVVKSGHAAGLGK